MLILASQSPRRREILTQLGLSFRVVPATGEEIIPEGVEPQAVCAALAAQKAHEVAEKFPDDVVLGADTLVVLDGQLLGKPKDEADAVRMLTLLSGRVHEVMTGVCILCGGRCEQFVERTSVRFFPLSSDEIAEYAASGEPLDKAGAYGIQGRGAAFIQELHGDYLNVVGLPGARVLRALRTMPGGIDAITAKNPG